MHTNATYKMASKRNRLKKLLPIATDIISPVILVVS